MSTIPNIPHEEDVEAIFAKILNSPGACTRLSDLFYSCLDVDELMPDDDSTHFAKVLFNAYEKRDISALLLEICGRSMFDLLREAYLIPKRFHGKAGMNPHLLTDKDGFAVDASLFDDERKPTAKELARLTEVRQHHKCIENSNLFLADGYDIARSYTEGLDIEEKLCNRRRGILALYELPDTASLGMTEAEAYAIIWDAFCAIQHIAPSAAVYYGQDTGDGSCGRFDEIGVLLPLHEFEKQILEHLDSIDEVISSCRQKMLDCTGE